MENLGMTVSYYRTYALLAVALTISASWHTTEISSGPLSAIAQAIRNYPKTTLFLGSTGCWIAKKAYCAYAAGNTVFQLPSLSITQNNQTVAEELTIDSAWFNKDTFKNNPPAVLTAMTMTSFVWVPIVSSALHYCAPSLFASSASLTAGGMVQDIVKNILLSLFIDRAITAAHELGHAMSGYAVGNAPQEIYVSINPLKGGSTRFNNNSLASPHDALKNSVVTVMGPITGALCAELLRRTSTHTHIKWLCAVQIALNLAQLYPVKGSDGESIKKSINDLDTWRNFKISY